MRSITLTFDNLGEATALERGTWDGTTPLGADPSVTIALPRLLDELDRHGLTATFCIEAINCGLNPQAVLSISERGHEIAVHGWRHEPWEALAPDHERDLLRRSLRAFRAIGIRPVGFRPPGGGPAAADPGMLADAGLVWWSPAVTEGPQTPLMTGTDITPVPFSWDWVDAYLLMESFTALRTDRGDPTDPLDAPAAGRRLRARIARATGPNTLVMHPFLMVDDAWWGETRELLALLAARVREGVMQCRTAGQAAAA